MAGYKHLEIVQDFDKYVKDKKASAKAYYRYFLSRLIRMFEYKNLPDTIPHEILDRYLFENGIACITKVNGELYCFYGNLGGEQDVYYRPTLFIVSNPHLKTENGELFTANIPVFPSCDKDVGQPTGVLIRNDTDWQGLHPLIARYSYLMAENILTLRTADVMLRITSLLTAPSDKERAASLEYLKSIEKGELGVIGESPFFDGIKLQSPPSNNGSYLTQFIEYQQYLKGSFYNEMGLSSNYNMKREAIGKGESTLDEDALLPLVDNMLKCRQEDMKKVNDMFGTDIEVSFSSSWLENQIESYSILADMVGQPTNSASMGQPSIEPSNGDVKSTEPSLVGQPTESDSNAPTEGRENVANGSNEEDGADGAKEANEANEEPGAIDEDDGLEEPESINDTGADQILDELMDKVIEKVQDDGVMNDGLTQTTEERGEDDADEKESSDDKGNISDT